MSTTNPQTQIVTPPSVNQQTQTMAEQPVPGPDIPPVVTTSGKKGGGGLGAKKVATILGLLLLVGGVSTGVLLVQRQQDVREKAAVPDVVCNTASSSECAGKYEGSSCVGTGGAGVCESIPEDMYQCVCSVGDTDPLDTDEVQVECLDVRAYTVDTGEGIDITDALAWTRLTASDLTALSTGDYVYFTVVGQAEDPAGFTKAKFKINDEDVVTVTVGTNGENTRPRGASEPTNQREIYYRYQIPSGVTSFTVSASIYNADTQQWIDNL